MSCEGAAAGDKCVMCGQTGPEAYSGYLGVKQARGKFYQTKDFFFLNYYLSKTLISINSF